MKRQDSPEQSAMIFCLGVLGGVIATIFGIAGSKEHLYSSFSSSDVATLVAAFFGAGVGGGISWLMARNTSRETLERDENARKQEKRASGLNLLIKHSMLVTEMYAMKNGIETSLAKAQAAGLGHLPLWRRVGGVVGSADFKLDPGELLPVLDARKYELMGTIIESFMQHQTLVKSARMYLELRAEAERVMSVNVDPTAQATAVAPFELKLESLITAIKARLDDCAPKCRTALFELGPVLKTHLDDDSFPVFGEDNEP
jgi:hypothetical protein